MKNQKLLHMLAALLACACPSVVNGRQMTPFQQPQGAFEDLEAQVTATEGAQASAGVLIGELAKYIEAHKNDPAALQTLVDRLKTSSDALAAAVATTPDPDPND